jgi:hypothetical protein
MNLAFGTTTADASTRPLGTRLAELSRNGAGLMSEIILRGARRPERESAAPNLVVKSHFGQPSRGILPPPTSALAGSADPVPGSARPWLSRGRIR